MPSRSALKQYAAVGRDQQEMIQNGLNNLSQLDQITYLICIIYHVEIIHSDPPPPHRLPPPPLTPKRLPGTPLSTARAMRTLLRLMGWPPPDTLSTGLMEV